ncbi:hypothetical protein HZC34_02620 [Candidatus Saganbacteria bacterium]|nr:hypothetical protein [Candidatus Saganbacteria bacterium]
MLSLRNKRILILLLVVLLLISFCSQSFAKKKYKKTYRKKGLYYYKPKTLKLYQELALSPKISQADMPKIESILKEKGANSIKFDVIQNSIQVQYSSKVMTAVDIMQILKELGYFVVTIN